MITLEKIDHFFSIYRKNYQHFCEGNEKIYEKVSLDDWMACLKMRASATAVDYAETKHIIETIWLPLKRHPELLLPEHYERLYYWMNEMYLNFDDLFILGQLTGLLLSYYEAKHDIEHLPLIYLCAGYVAIELSRIHLPGEGSRSVSFYGKAARMHVYFDRFQNPENRVYVMAAYCNLIRVEISIGNMSLEEVYPWYLELKELQSRENFERYVEETPRMKLLADYSVDDFESNAALVLTDTADDSFKEEMNALTRSFYERKIVDPSIMDDLSPSYINTYYQLQVHDGKMTADDAFVQLERILLKGFLTNETLMEIDPIGTFINPLSNLVDFIASTDLSPEMKSSKCMAYKNQALTFVRSYPYGLHSYSLNQGLQDFCSGTCILTLLSSVEERRNLLLDCIISRQLPTYIHSLMVANLAKEITRAILEFSPQWLYVDTPDICINSPEAVKTQAHRILEFIWNAGILHDIGKVGLIDIINTEYRDLTELEFQAIRMHPAQGAEIIAKAPGLQVFTDIVLGHHKSYDGQSGYPADFDNTKSALRFYIDIIHVCDCLDAATDHLGRNYAKAKSFRTVLDELISGMGTAYNPDLVAFLRDHTGLCAALTRMLGEDRYLVYQEVYQHYFTETENAGKNAGGFTSAASSVSPV